MHVAVPRCSGAAAWTVPLTSLYVWETAVSLNAVMTRSFGCLISTASRAHDGCCGIARGECEHMFIDRGVSQEGEGRDLRVITSVILIVQGHRVAELHAFLLLLHSWLAR